MYNIYFFQYFRQQPKKYFFFMKKHGTGKKVRLTKKKKMPYFSRYGKGVITVVPQ